MTFLNGDNEGMTGSLRCPRCDGPAKLMGIQLSADGFPSVVIVCPTVGLTCSGKKLTDYPLTLQPERVQMDINMREFIRRFQAALSTIAKLKAYDGDPRAILSEAVNIAGAVLASVVPVEGRSIGAPPEARAAQTPAQETRTPGGIVIPAPGTYPRSCVDCGTKVMARKDEMRPLCANCALLRSEKPPLHATRPCRSCRKGVAIRDDSGPEQPLCPECRAELTRISAEIGAPPPPARAGFDNRTCITCGANVEMPVDSEDTPICPACEKKIEDGSGETEALDAEAPTPSAGTPRQVKNDCAVCGAATGEPCDPKVPHPGFKVGGAPPPKRPDIPPPPAPPSPEQPVHKLYGYPDEETYYRTEWGGADCPACSKTLDPTGRRHADGSECPDAV